MKLRYDKNHKLMNFSDSATPYFTEELTPDDLILDVGMNEPKDGDIREIIKSLDDGDKAQLKKVMNEWININPVSSDELAMNHGAKRLQKFLNFSDSSMNKITTKVDLKTNEGKVIPAGSNIKYGWIPGMDPDKDWVMFIYWNGKTYTKSNMDAADIEELTNGSMNINFSERIQKSIDKLNSFSKSSSKYFRVTLDDHITWTQGKGFNSREKATDLIKSNISSDLAKDISMIGGGMALDHGKVSWAIIFKNEHNLDSIKEAFKEIPSISDIVVE